MGIGRRKNIPMKQDAAVLGTGNITKLLLKQAVPASIGILFMTVNLLVDTILVGRWIGPLAIAALTVVTPVALLIGSVGFAIGIGGSSVLSRALGANNTKKATAAFAHQLWMTSLVCGVFVAVGLVFADDLLTLFGAKGDILAPAKIFYYPILLAAPLQALCGVGNSVMRAEHRSRFAMLSLVIPSVGNILLDVLFIKILGWGIFGAAMATAISFAMCFVFGLWYFIYKSEIRPAFSDFKPNAGLSKEISSLSLTTFARQGVIGILSILLNQTLFEHGGELAVTAYGIISKMLMFALFPVNGIVEGFMPVAGYNYGAEKFGRVRKSIFTSIKFAGGFAIVVYALILIFATPIVSAFTKDQSVVKLTPDALRWVFAASPVIAIQLIGAAYFQSAGKAAKALMLTLTKQGFFLIPLILVLPDYFGIFGIWVSFPIADVLATAVTGLFLNRELRTKLK
jgi:putative MATE family efflux protein